MKSGYLKFKHNESDYENWLKENCNSFVFNHFGTSENNKMHHVKCYQLHRPQDSGSRTNYEKICSNSLKELEELANELSKGGWFKCKFCFKDYW